MHTRRARQAWENKLDDYLPKITLATNKQLMGKHRKIAHIVGSKMLVRKLRRFPAT